MEDKKEAEKIPIFKSWKTWYFVVLGNLIFLIIIFYLFTSYFS
ncbi:hypothetical protein [Fulvivirga ligni]|nr:hypothetical protein [Fulvivirga ligni]